MYCKNPKMSTATQIYYISECVVNHMSSQPPTTTTHMLSGTRPVWPDFSLLPCIDEKESIEVLQSLDRRSHLSADSEPIAAVLPPDFERCDGSCAPLPVRYAYTYLCVYIYI